MDLVAIEALDFEIRREENCLVRYFRACIINNGFTQVDHGCPIQCRGEFFVGEMHLPPTERVCDSKRDQIHIFGHENDQEVTKHVEEDEANATQNKPNI